MKQPAVRISRRSIGGWSISGWSIGIVALTQLPALASNPAPAAPSVQASLVQASLVQASSSQLPLSQPPLSQTERPIGSSPQLIAVALSSRELRPGDTGADVRVLQRYLSRNGLYPFIIDGTYGQETANSVATYQRIRNLPATGIADEETLIDMDFEFLPAAASSTAPSPSVSRGSTSLGAGGLAPGAVGSDVIALQERLNAYGIPVLVDGVYGFETQEGVRTYQRVQGLTATGVADSDTLESMGFTATNSYPYVAAIIADESELATVRQFFENAYMDRNRRGRFINIGSFDSRFPAEARVDAAAARGFSSRVLYR